MPRKLIHLLWQWLLCGFQQRAQCQRHPDTAQFGAVRRQEAGQSAKSQAAGQMRAKRKPTKKKTKKNWEKLLGRFTMPRHVNIWRHLYKKRRNPGPACPYQSNYLEDASKGNLFLSIPVSVSIPISISGSGCVFVWLGAAVTEIKYTTFLLIFCGGFAEFQIVTMMVNLCEGKWGQELEEIGMNRAEARPTHSWKRKVESGSRE